MTSYWEISNENLNLTFLFAKLSTNFSRNWIELALIFNKQFPNNGNCKKQSILALLLKSLSKKKPVGLVDPIPPGGGGLEYEP